jgi:hypothetical protein
MLVHEIIILWAPTHTPSYELGGQDGDPSS